MIAWVSKIMPNQLNQLHSTTYTSHLTVQAVPWMWKFLSVYIARFYTNKVIRLFAFVSMLLVLSFKYVGAENSKLSCSSSEQCISQGQDLFHRSLFRQSVVKWKEAIELYKQHNQIKGQVFALTQLSQVYHAMRLYQDASRVLDIADQLYLNDQHLIASSQISLIRLSRGNIAMATKKFKESRWYLDNALALVIDRNDLNLEVVIYNSLGNLFMLQNRYKEALEAYNQSSRLAKKIDNLFWVAKSLIHASMAATQDEQDKEAQMRLDDAWAIIQDLPNSHDKGYTLLDLGLAYYALWQRLRAINRSVALGPANPIPISGCRDRIAHLSEVFYVSTTSESSPVRHRALDFLLLKAGKALREVVDVASGLGDLRMLSYAWGYLGHLYEAEQRCEEALQLTQQAIFSAQQIYAPEVLYKWQWQTGRVLKAQGKLDEATRAFRQAVETLQSVDPKLLIGSDPDPSSFREAVKPVFLGLVDLLLRHSASQQAKDSYRLLIEARHTAERLKVAELQDYFRDNCINLEQKGLVPLDKVLERAPTSVIIYPILLKDRLELLVTVPTGLLRYTVPVGEETIGQEIKVWRQKLEDQRTWEFLPHARQLYEWLIRPFEKDLPASTDTLVFVPDGLLLTIPMAALVDGEKFLIQKYAVAITPGLRLQSPRPLQKEKIKILAVGLTESVYGFSPLPQVAEELNIVQDLYPNRSVLLRDQDFVINALEDKLQDPELTIVHIASHAQFHSDAEQTFILTSDDRLTLDHLETFVKRFRFRDNPLELLTLSACDTAVGDERAALGLAGLAIKAGAKSAIATLWNIDDPVAAQLVTEFYRHLKETNVSRAVALQKAQLALLNEAADTQDYQHPAFWSPFLLINNWL